MTIQKRENEDRDQGIREGGGGVAEGFELAEEELIGQAEHADPPRDPMAQAGEPEAERDGAVHGESDEIISTETEADGVAPADRDPE